MGVSLQCLALFRPHTGGLITTRPNPRLLAVDIRQGGHDAVHIVESERSDVNEAFVLEALLPNEPKEQGRGVSSPAELQERYHQQVHER